MLPVLTPSQMAAVDAAATVDEDVLIGRAAAAVARTAIDLMGGAYGRRVIVVAGPGNNGADGRVAAGILRRRGVRVVVHDLADAPAVLGPADLVVDAAFGTGFRGTYSFPDPDGAPVLAVDVPSGVSGLTGLASGEPAHAVATVTFAALKPGLLLHDGPAHAGEVVLADIGLDVEDAEVVGPRRVHLVTDADVLAWVPDRTDDDHKWRHAVRVVAGSPGMSGAALLCATAALRAGAGYVRLTVPGDDRPDAPVEAVVEPLAEDDWAEGVGTDADRFGCLAIGPGLGRADATAGQVRVALRTIDRPVVVDGDGLWVIGDSTVDALHARPGPTVLTPHDGEFERLTGGPPGDDRIDAARGLAGDTGAVVLLKGPTTVVADPGGDVLLVRSGDARLATAGTGDVLTGTIAALVAAGASPFHAAAAGAHLHGRAALLGPDRGLVAGDVAEALPAAWASLVD
ncbi:NAD(P)H-hydrate dehydratase [Dermatobacter hominis]|uniref:NAD(P)H-hydrate dehydratase n=1 Tax=Dermatobacter hominis TaxID=2884263 RepID=UPI001D11BD6C|nr:NAD(P)H-hydrate dehydratase [Dermatobacter hominis]UDY38020.1 NAD(P)H-hydrate dehydratase [Dermatobacter hominis]